MRFIKKLLLSIIKLPLFGLVSFGNLLLKTFGVYVLMVCINPAELDFDSWWLLFVICLYGFYLCVRYLYLPYIRKIDNASKETARNWRFLIVHAICLQLIFAAGARLFALVGPIEEVSEEVLSRSEFLEIIRLMGKYSNIFPSA